MIDCAKKRISRAFSLSSFFSEEVSEKSKVLLCSFRTNPSVQYDPTIGSY